MKSKWRGALIGGIIGVILALILTSGLNITWISSLIIVIVGIVSGVILSLKSKRKNKLVIVLGWVGFLIPWIYFAYLNISCSYSECGHLGMALPSIFIYSIITCIIGIIGGIFFNKFKK